MEVMFFLVIVVISIVAFMFVKFSNFKSKIMNEFGKRGVAYSSADVLYTIFASQISDMHHAGCSIPDIVDFVMANIDIQDTRKIDKNIGSGDVFSTYDEWYASYMEECERLDPEKNKWQVFLNDDPLRLAFDHGKDPKEIAKKWVENFDPMESIESHLSGHGR